MLFSHAQKRENEYRKFLADIHGAKLVEEKSMEYNGDPESVAHLSQEEKEELTRRLMSQHRQNFDTVKGIGT